MATIKNCTDLPQSKKLAKFLPLESADMVWTYDFTVNDINGINVIANNFKIEENDIPAWSLTALEAYMPFQLIENNNRYGFYQSKGFNKQGETYRFGYKSNDNSFLFETSWSNNPIDAAFEMVCWLKENNKI